MGRSFCWEKGRIIHALQLVAIRRGKGLAEWLRERQKIESGTVLILLPGEWHRYRPATQTGWTEDWFEVKGYLLEHWLDGGLFEHRFFELQTPEYFFEQFDQMHRIAQDSMPAPEGALESQACALIAGLLAGRNSPEEQNASSRQRKKIVEAGQLLVEGSEIPDIAERLGLSYQSLYRHFKQATGLSPKQFAERARMARAEAMLGDDPFTVKEIAHRLGYHSASHFSLAFKRSYGCSPLRWRKHLSEQSLNKGSKPKRDTIINNHDDH